MNQKDRDIIFDRLRNYSRGGMNPAFRQDMNDLLDYTEELEKRCRHYLMASKSELCAETHLQCCSWCDRMDCCDNTSQAKKTIDKLKTVVDVAKEIVEYLQNNPRNDHFMDSGLHEFNLLFKFENAIKGVRKSAPTLKPAHLWEILVPYCDKDGLLINIEHHWKWDEKVKKIAGGLTIYRSAKGIWVDKIGRTVKERMIPVRIECSEDSMFKIANITKEHYGQDFVFVCRVSDDVRMI